VTNSWLALRLNQLELQSFNEEVEAAFLAFNVQSNEGKDFNLEHFMTNANVLFSHLVKLGLISLLAFSVGCSKKKNKTDGGINNSQYTLGIGATNNIMSIANQRCTSGQRAPNRYFYSYNNSGLNTISGSFVSGTIGGALTRRYFGINTLGDAIEIQKMTNGNTTVGYNIILSLCDTPINNTSLYLAHRDIISLQGTAIVGDSYSCVDGNVNYGSFMVQLAPYNTTYNGQNYTLNSVSINVPFSGYCQ
jgi:hypothetical protein